jgi:hypothetical protein
MSRTSRYLVLVVSLLFPVLNIAQGQSEAARQVSFIQLIADPGKFDGKLIFVTAFLGLDPPDGNMLYLHKEDYDNAILLNAVGIDLSKQMWADREKLDLNYVSVVGIFRSGEKSHNRYNGITNVTNCVLKAQPSNRIRQRPHDLHKPDTNP